MAQPRHPTKKTAKARLTDMRTHAVGIVDRPANGRSWLTLKSQEGQVDEKDKPVVVAEQKADPPVVTDPPVVEEPAAVAPTSMSQAMADGIKSAIAQTLEALSAVAEMVQSATIDDAAAPPADLLARVDAIADELDEAIDILMPAMAEGDPALDLGADVDDTMKSTDSQKAKTPVMAGRKRRLMAMKRLKSMGEHHKSIAEGHKMIGKGMSGIDAMMKELSGGGKSKEEPPAAAEETTKALTSTAVIDLAALAFEVKKAFAPDFAKLTASGLRASAPVPRAKPNDGEPPPKQEAPANFKRMLDEATKKG